MKIETLAVHAGRTIDPATGAVAAPIHLSTTFERDVEGTYPRGFMYTRNNNPNREALERGVSAIEGGEVAAAFASGTGAAMSLVPGAFARRPCARPRRRVLRNFAIIARPFPALGFGSRFRRHEQPRRREKSNPAENETCLDGNAIQSALENCRPGRGRRRFCAAPARFPFATTPGRQSCNGRSISASISSCIRPRKYFGGHCDVLGGIIVAQKR